MTRYRVELEELLTFVGKLEAFEQRAETLAAHVKKRISALHEDWAGEAASAHRADHDEWMAAAAQMKQALVQLRQAAHSAHRNYCEAVELNLAMLS